MIACWQTGEHCETREYSDLIILTVQYPGCRKYASKNQNKANANVLFNCGVMVNTMT